MREDVDSHRRNTKLYDEVWIEKRLDRHVAWRRTSEEIRERLDEPLSVGAGGRYEQVQIFGRAGPGVEGQGVGSADQVAYVS